jgi:hypothetical protein
LQESEARPLSGPVAGPFRAGPKKSVTDAAGLASIPGMRGIAVVVSGVSLCVAAYACGGASGTQLSSPMDGGSDGTTSLGGDDGAPPPGEPGAGDASPGTNPTPASDGQAPAVVDGGPALAADGGSPAATDGGPADGAVADARAPLSCGSGTCSTGQFCCAELDGGAGCQTSEQACLALAGVPRRCEKTADCPANNVCCYEFTSTPATTSCHANDCNGGNGMCVEACQSQGDCTTGTCAAHACIAGGSIQACAAFGTECP